MEGDEEQHEGKKRMAQTLKQITEDFYKAGKIKQGKEASQMQTEELNMVKQQFDDINLQTMMTNNWGANSMPDFSKLNRRKNMPQPIRFGAPISNGTSDTRPMTTQMSNRNMATLSRASQRSQRRNLKVNRAQFNSTGSNWYQSSQQ